MAIATSLVEYRVTPAICTWGASRPRDQRRTSTFAARGRKAVSISATTSAYLQGLFRIRDRLRRRQQSDRHLRLPSLVRRPADDRAGALLVLRLDPRGDRLLLRGRLRDLTLRHPLDAELLHELLDPARGDTGEVGVGDHRHKRLLRPAARLQQPVREVAASLSFGTASSIEPTLVSQSRSR